MAVDSCAVVRPRNARGEGAKLRADILAAATAILDEIGSLDAVTLRAVARRVGISAPSIYAHFPDRQAILEAVVDNAFAQLIDALNAAVDTERDPVARLRLGCGAYLRFAAERPQPYRVMFQRGGPPNGDTVTLGGPALGAEAFDILVSAIKECAIAGRSTSIDPFADAAAVWVAMHGYSLLHTGLPGFPWPAEDQVFDRIVLRLAGIPGDSAPGDPVPGGPIPGGPIPGGPIPGGPIPGGPIPGDSA
jgi:AcrR family transcriptional regulator